MGFVQGQDGIPIALSRYRSRPGMPSPTLFREGAVRGIPGRIGLKALGGAVFGLVLLFATAGSASAVTVVQLSWSANNENDLAGYRLQYGTASGVYNYTVDVGKVTSYAVQGLDSNTTYYFALKAYDYSGNVSSPSSEVSGKPKVVAGPLPTIASALEVSTGSVYVLQAGQHTVRVDGTNFQSGAVVDFGPDATEGPTSLSGSTRLTLTVTLGASATLGPRGITITNPDTGVGSRPGVLKVARTTDINRSCQIDGMDLNLLARTWNTSGGDAAYTPACDLDGVNGVDGDDLAIFIEYFGQRLAVCP